MLLSDRVRNPQHYLKPGELCCADRPLTVVTVLGSCVSATFFHSASGLAAMCHVLHPGCPRPTACADCGDACYWYAPCAIETMARWMTGHRVRLDQVTVKLFGGAAMLGQPPERRGPVGIGQLNVAAVLKAFQRLGITLKVADVGGHTGRKLLFDTATGEVWLKRLGPAASPGPHGEDIGIQAENLDGGR